MDPRFLKQKYVPRLVKEKGSANRHTRKRSYGWWNDHRSAYFRYYLTPIIQVLDFRWSCILLQKLRVAAQQSVSSKQHTVRSQNKGNRLIYSQHWPVNGNLVTLRQFVYITSSKTAVRSSEWQLIGHHNTRAVMIGSLKTCSPWHASSSVRFLQSVN